MSRNCSVTLLFCESINPKSGFLETHKSFFGYSAFLPGSLELHLHCSVGFNLKWEKLFSERPISSLFQG